MCAKEYVHIEDADGLRKEAPPHTMCEPPGSGNGSLKAAV